MSRYKRGDVVKAPFAYFDKNSGLMAYKIRPFVVIDVEEETDNITVSCSSQLWQSKNFKGIVVYANSSVGKQMGINQDHLFTAIKQLPYQIRIYLEELAFAQ
jgi:hypothetical protein